MFYRPTGGSHPMPRPLRAPKVADARSLTDTTARLIAASSTTRRRRPLCSRLVRGFGPALWLFLLCPGVIGAEGLTLDLPTTPVQMAAASDGSAVASVDLSDPTKFPFSSTGKWKGYLEFLGKPGTERSLGQPDLLLPLLQNKNNMTFLNVRGQLQFDNTDVHEYNIGLGHRHMFTDWILGGYGYYDKRHTQFGSSYNQFTGGLELMSVDWAFRANGYLPENKTETITSGANVTVIRPGDQINVQIDGIVQEKALPGVDGEVGYLLPIPWKETYELRVYAGGYHFFGEDNFESVTGPRGRVEWRAYDLPVLGPGSRFMMGVEAQWDEPRGSQAFGLASLRIPFDVFSDKSKRKGLKGLDRRMLQPVIRDVDVVTSEHNVPAEILPALNPAGKVYTKAIDVTLDEMEGAIEEHEDEVVAIFVDGEGAEEVDVADGQFKGPGNNQTVSIMGRELKVGYQGSQWLGTGTVGYTPDGTPFTLKRGNGDCDGGSGTDSYVISLAPGGHLNGLAVDGAGCRRGIDTNGLGEYWVTNSQAWGASQSGMHVRNGATTYISDSEFFNNWHGIRVNATDGVSTAVISHSQIHNNGDTGVAAIGDARHHRHITILNSQIYENTNRGIDVDGTTLTIGNSHIYDNDQIGVSASNGSTATISQSFISDNDSNGVNITGSSEATISNSHIYNNGLDGVNIFRSEATISNSLIYNNGVRKVDNIGHGIRIESASTLTLSDSYLFGNSRDGMFIGGPLNGSAPNTVIIRNSHFYDNDSQGLEIEAGSTVSISESRIYDNFYDGIFVEYGADVTVSNSIISNNGWHGVYTSTLNGQVNGETADPSTEMSTSTIRLNNVTITGNGTSGFGYGVFNEGSDVTLTNSLVSGNTSGKYFNQIGTVNSGATCIRREGFIEVVGDGQVPHTFVDDNDSCTKALVDRP